MLDKNFGFSGNIPDGVSIENNIKEALEYKNTHNEIETLFWFREKVGNNKDERLIPQSESMDYKQIDSKYAEFGNFNYGAVGTALGYPSEFLKLMAGAAQLISDKEATNWLDAVPKASILENYGDNLEDQIVIQFGIKSANSAGFNNTVDEFIENINNLTQIQQNKYEAWESLSPEKKAEWIKSGKFPWDYEEDASPTDWNNANDPSITEEETNSGGEEYSIVDIRHPDNVQRAKDEYHAKVALDRFSKGEDITLKEVIQAVEKSPNIMNKLKEVLLAKGNDDVADWITKDGQFKPNTPPDIKERFFLEAEEGNRLSTQLGSTIGGSIGSVIIGNNDFSNIEKIAISTSTTVVGQNVGEYIFWDSKNGNGSGAFDDIGADFKNTLQGVICY